MRMGRLAASYLHDLSSGGDAEWLEKHRRYARAEAKAHLAASPPASWRQLLGADSLKRRRALKQLSYRLPARPFLRFIYQYFVRGGLLDGRAGLHYCQLLARYEAFANEELRKLRVKPG